MRVLSAIGIAAVAVGLVFTLVPGLDLGAARLFYTPGAGFLQDGAAWEHLLYESVDWIVGAAVIGSIVMLVLEAVRPGPMGRNGKVAALLLVTLAIGPGLIVNGVLKEHWGRARPRDVTEFGGDRRFTPVLEVSDQCERNCSFSAGHPSAGFALAALGYAALSRRRRRKVIAAATTFGLVVGLARIAAGAHFLSDVLFSGLIVLGLIVLLGDRWIGPPEEP